MGRKRTYRITGDMIALILEGDEVTGTKVLSAEQTVQLEGVLDEGKTAQVSLRGQRYLVSARTLMRRSVSTAPELESCPTGHGRGSCCLEMRA